MTPKRNLYDRLPPQDRAAIEWDALPKDGTCYVTELSRARLKTLRQRHIDSVRETNGKPLTPQEALEQEAQMEALKEAYRNKVHADSCKDANPALADELYKLETEYLQKVPG